MSAPTLSAAAQATTAAVAAAGNPEVDAPRVPLSHLTGAVADEVREVGRRRLAEYDRHPDASGVFGSGGGPDRLTRDEERPKAIAIYVYDDAAVASGASWHRYWRSFSDDPRQQYRQSDPVRAAGAPPHPSYGIRCVATATWEQLRDWLDAPEQTSLFDQLGGVA